MRANGLIKLRDGEVVLYRRPDSTQWQARLKLPNGRWHRISTKRGNLTEAKRIAGEAYDRARFREQEGLAAVARRFREVAKHTIKLLEAKTAAGQGKVAYKDYVQAINNYLIPYFGQKLIDKISQDDITTFEAWRITKMARTPAASTVLNHNAALHRVFDTALAEGWITKKSIPDIKTSGAKSQRRPAFTVDEWRRITTSLPHWVKRATSSKNEQYRELMRDYVLILANTGIRTGKEALSLKWNQLHWGKDKNGEQFLAITITGKTGPRTLVARHGCVDFFKRIQSRFPDLAKKSFDDLLKSKNTSFVFRLRNGKRPENFCHLFSEFLTDRGLLNDPLDNKRTLYSLRHTYATLQLSLGNAPIHPLSKQMGTSISMLEKHYSHLEPVMVADIFAGKRYKNAGNSAKKRPIKTIK